MQDGVHKLRADSEQPGIDVLKLLKTQDIGYVSVKQRAEAKKIERLRASLHRADGAARGHRTVFADGGEGDLSLHDDAQATKWRQLSKQHKPRDVVPTMPVKRSRSRSKADDAKDEDHGTGSKPSAEDENDDDDEVDLEDEDDNEGPGGGEKQPERAPEVARLGAAAAADALAALVTAGRAGAEASRRESSAATVRAEAAAAPASQLLAAALAEEATRKVSSRLRRKRAKAAAKRSTAAYGELHDREERAAVLGKAAAHFEYQRHLMGKGRRVRVKAAEGGRPAVFKWKQERKR